jgi:hypothetical protein
MFDAWEQRTNGDAIEPNSVESVTNVWGELANDDPDDHE